MIAHERGPIARRPGHVYLWTATHHERVRREVGDATLRVDLHALDPAGINPTRTWFSRRGTFGRWVSIDLPLLDPATWQETPGGERSFPTGRKRRPDLIPRGYPHVPRGGADRFRGTIRPEALAEASWPPR